MNTKVVIYSRANCHLCEEAEKNVREVLVEIHFGLEVILEISCKSKSNGPVILESMDFPAPGEHGKGLT